MKCSQCKGCIQSQCKAGFYGPSCNLPCYPNCRALACSACTCEVCNVTSGSCTNGCDFGFYGSHCELICPVNCRKLRRKGITCDQTSGFCLNGCQRGFYGDTCNNTCNTRCKASVCLMTNGSCISGCVDGYGGEFCNISARSTGRWDQDEIAGALGGGFVVILWAAVVVILIFVIWKRRLKDLDVFKRNTPIGEGPRRGSSRRPLRRRDSESSINQECLLSEQQSHELQHSGHKLLEGTRSVTFEIQSPLHCTCSRDLFIYPENGEHFMLESPYGTSDLNVYFKADEKAEQSIQNTRRASSEGDLSEMSAVWKPVKF